MEVCLKINLITGRSSCRAHRLCSIYRLIDRARQCRSFAAPMKSFQSLQDVTEQLLALSRPEGATLFMTLLAAFNVLLYRYTGQQDILVGTPIANRNRAEIEGLIGFFVNTLVLRAKMESDESFLSLLRQVRDHDARCVRASGPAVREVSARVAAGARHEPLAAVSGDAGLQNAPQQAFELPGLTLSAFETKSRTAKFDLMLTLAEEN